MTTSTDDRNTDEELILQTDRLAVSVGAHRGTPRITIRDRRFHAFVSFPPSEIADLAAGLNRALDAAIARETETRSSTSASTSGPPEDYALIHARFPGRCQVCGGDYAIGDKVAWAKATKFSAHARCVARGEE